MHSPFGFRFIFGIVAGILLLIWSTYSIISLSRSPARDSIVYFNRHAPVTQLQIDWAMFCMGGVFIALALTFRPRQ
jgi:hypothetical protein